MKYIEKNFDKIGVIVIFYLVIIAMAFIANRRFQELNKEEVSSNIAWTNE